MRKWLNLFENGHQWPESISGDDLSDLAREWHHTPEDFDDGDIHANIVSYGTYNLKRVPLDSLGLEYFTIHDSLVNDYAALDTQAPPIILPGLSTGVITDGNHRANAALKRGDTHILAYVGDPATTRGYAEDDDEEWKPEGEW